MEIYLTQAHKAYSLQAYFFNFQCTEFKNMLSALMWLNLLFIFFLRLINLSFLRDLSSNAIKFLPEKLFANLRNLQTL